MHNVNHSEKFSVGK